MSIALVIECLQGGEVLQGFFSTSPRCENVPGRLASTRPESTRGSCLAIIMIEPEDLIEPEWVEWYSLTPLERFEASERLWEQYLSLGGSLDPEPDTQSPFFDPEAPCAKPDYGRAGLRVVRRGGV